MRKPLGDWKPKTTKELDSATDFENEALQDEVERDTLQWAGSIEESHEYKIGDKAFELEPKVLDGLLNSEVEE